MMICKQFDSSLSGERRVAIDQCEVAAIEECGSVNHRRITLRSGKTIDVLETFDELKKMMALSTRRWS